MHSQTCALFIFAGLVVGTALLGRPAGVAGLTGFLVEMFAMFFPAGILFLAFNVLDLRRGRVSRTLGKGPDGRCGLVFQDTEREGRVIEHSNRRAAERLISVLAGLAVIVAYGVLFLYKWGQAARLNPWGTGF